MTGNTDKGGMNLIFICPRTNLKVQHRTERDGRREHEYEAVTCLACQALIARRSDYPATGTLAAGPVRKI